MPELRSVYGNELTYYTAAGGMNDPNSYYIHDAGGYLFFHLTHDATGTVDQMATGATIRDAYC